MRKVVVNATERMPTHIPIISIQPQYVYNRANNAAPNNEMLPLLITRAHTEGDDRAVCLGVPRRLGEAISTVRRNGRSGVSLPRYRRAAGGAAALGVSTSGRGQPGAFPTV